MQNSPPKEAAHSATTPPILFHTIPPIRPSAIKNRHAVRRWIASAIKSEGKNVGAINFICCSDEYLVEIHSSYLKNNDLTDVITFDYCEDTMVSGDIYMSLDRIQENAKKYKTRIREELHRVMVHGVLHLIGYKDKKPADQLQMTKKEDFYLSLREF